MTKQYDTVAALELLLEDLNIEVPDKEWEEKIGTIQHHAERLRSGNPERILDFYPKLILKLRQRAAYKSGGPVCRLWLKVHSMYAQDFWNTVTWTAVFMPYIVCIGYWILSLM